MRHDKTREQAGKIRERTGRKKMRPPPLSAKEERHIEQPQAQQHLPTSTHYYESTSSPEHSCSPFLDGGMIFSPLFGMLDPCQPSSNNQKLISFDTTYKKKKNCLSLYVFLPFLACTDLNNACNLVSRALLVSVCLFKKNRSMYCPIVSRFG